MLSCIINWLSQEELEKYEGSTQESGQPQATESAQTVEKKDEEKTEMKLKDRGKLFVGGLNHGTTTEGLKDYFSRFGSIVDAVVMTFPKTKKSRGYGFVTFADPVSAEIALKTETHVIDGKAVDIRLFESNRSDSKLQKKKRNRRIFLGGVPFDMNEEDLKNFFNRYGKVTDVLIPHDKSTNKPKGFAFLSFEEKEAAEKCISESFVYLRNKRVIIKKATAKGESAETMSDVADGVECFESDPESAAGGGDDVWSLPDGEDDDDQSSASGDKTSLFEQYPGFGSIFENYFQPKIALCHTENKMEKGEEQEWQPPSRQEWEKLFVSLLRESTRAGGDTLSDEDVTDDDSVYNRDFDESEESVSDEEEEEDDDDYSVDEEEENDVDNDDLLYEKLTAKFKEILMAKPTEEKIENLKSSVPENKVPVLQNASLPFIVKDKVGSLSCSLCQWTPPDGSNETFLAHCKTPGHRMKTKERFMPEDIQQGKPKNKPANLSRETEPGMVSSETRLNRIQQGLPEQQNKIQTAQDSKEQRKKKLQPPQQQQQQSQVAPQVGQQQSGQQIPESQSQKKKKKQQQPPGQQVQQQPGQQVQQKKKAKQQQQPGQTQTPQTSQPKKQKNAENQSENKKIKNTGNKRELNLKVHALAKGMVCIQPVSQNELSCRMCNKVIPKAPDFGTLMKNVSLHLQSKGHLNKLAATESSLKIALDKKPEEPGAQAQKNVTGKNATKEKKEQAPGQKGVPPKGKNTGPGNNSKKTDKKTPKPAPPAPAAPTAPKTNYLCLTCNYFANKQETFNAHISSKVHLESLKKTNSKLSEFGQNSLLCKGCNRILYGSLYNINKHHTKCVK